MEALRQGLLWANPLAMLVWGKWPRERKAGGPGSSWPDWRRTLAGRLSDSPGRDRLAIGHARLPSGRVSSTTYRRVLTMSWFNFFRRKKYQVLDDAEDFLLVTWDSCRYDAYLEARTPALDQFGEPRRAWAMATYTLPAHEAMFYGFLPHVFEPEPLYNRYSQQVWRISHRNVDAKPLVTFPLGQGNIVNGFRRRGYATLGTAAMDWFRDAPELRQGFEKFEVSGVGAARQNQWLARPVGKAGEETALLRLRQLRRDPQPLPLRGHGDRRSRSRAAIRPAAALQSAGPLDRPMGVRPSGLPPAGRRRLLPRRGPPS